MQLFTHLLSSYLQGMEDFFSALPKGREFHIKPHSNPPKAPSRGWSTNCWPIPAFSKWKEHQLLAYPSLLQGEGVPTEAPSQLSPSGRNTNCWPIPAFFKGMEFQQKPLPTFHKGKERHPSVLNTERWDSRPLGRVGEGLQLRVILGLLPLAMLLEDYLPMTNSRVPPAMMSA